MLKSLSVLATDLLAATVPMVIAHQRTELIMLLVERFVAFPPPFFFFFFFFFNTEIDCFLLEPGYQQTLSSRKPKTPFILLPPSQKQKNKQKKPLPNQVRPNENASKREEELLLLPLVLVLLSFPRKRNKVLQFQLGPFQRKDFGIF